MDILAKDIEKIFLIGDKDHGDDPKTYDEVMSDIYFKKWLSAMKSKISLMHSNRVWTLVDPPEGIISIDCK